MYVVVTGASRGIGKEIAKIFGSHKYDLILTCEKNIDMLISLKSELTSKYGIDVKIKKGDIYDEMWYEDNIITEDIKKDVYIVINNQAKADYHILQDVDKKLYDDMIDSNITNAIFTTKYFLPYIIRRKEGKIVNITSQWGMVGASGETIYSMTKGAINIFTKALAKELKESNIDVIAYSLGIVDTDMCKGKEIEGVSKESPAKIANLIYESVIFNNYASGAIISLNNGINL